MKYRMPWLALVLVAVATPALAQSAVPTRAEEARSTRESKAASATTARPGKIERLLTWAETGPLQSIGSARDGFGIRLGGIENGAGLALGPSWRASNILDGTIHISASGAASSVGDRQVAAGLAAPSMAANRLALGLDLEATHLAQERFFGTSIDSARADATAFALDSRRMTARATLTATSWLQLGARAGTLSASAGDARTRRIPAIGTRFTSGDAPGLGADARFAVISLDATVDYRDVRQNPRGGGRYQVGVERYMDRAFGRHSFTRVDAAVEQHLAAWKRQRLVTLRAVASASAARPGHEVPFYLQRTLGGSSLLRGFVTDRFRDSNLLVLQAEYGWDVSPFLNAVLFYEAGAVAPRWQDLGLHTLRRDYGIGFRFGSARTVALRTDVALGSGEGARLSMRFNHAF